MRSILLPFTDYGKLFLSSKYRKLVPFPRLRHKDWGPSYLLTPGLSAYGNTVVKMLLRDLPQSEALHQKDGGLINLRLRNAVVP